MNKAIVFSLFLVLFSHSSTVLSDTCQTLYGINPGTSPKGREYVIKTQKNKYEIEGDLLNDLNKYVAFYTSHHGFVGEDKFNNLKGLKVIASKEISFANMPNSTSPNRQVVIMAEYGNRIYCRNIYVQDSGPKLSVKHTQVGSYDYAIFNYSIDQNSKILKESTPLTLKLYDSSNRVVNEVTIDKSVLSGEISIRGPLILENGTGRGVISDGTYSASAEFKRTLVSPIPAACKRLCPNSLGYFQSQCQGNSSACHYKVWGPYPE